MRWIEATVNTTSDGIEELCEQIEAFGVQGIQIEDEEDLKRFLRENQQYWDYIDENLMRRYKGISRVKFYLIDDEAGHQSIRRIQNGINREIQISYVDDADWQYTWKEHFQPTEIGEKLLVVPAWTDRIPEKESDRIPLRIEPGLAFGTGNHATTRMCLNLMQHVDIEGKRVLDLGCGSGILSIAALLLGCRTCTACDIDSNARTATAANAARNGFTDQPKMYIGNILTDRQLQKKLGGDYDLVTANIVADVILALCGMVGQVLRPEGRFLCSGIIENRGDEVRAALRENGWIIEESLQEEEWLCFLCKRRETTA